MIRNFLITSILAVAAFSILFSCAPQARYVELEEKIPAEFDLPLGGRKVAVFAVREEFDSEYMTGMLGGFVAKLANDKNLELDRIKTYMISNASYVKDSSSLKFLLAERGEELNFIISDVKIGESETLADKYYEMRIIPYSVRMGVYDSLSNVIYDRVHPDTVFIKAFSFAGEHIGEDEAYMAEISDAMGSGLAALLSEQWHNKRRVLASFSGNAWTKAYFYAQDFRWEDAIEIWMKLADSGNASRSAYAAYNVAVGCEVLGNTELAKKWLDYSLLRMETREALEFKEKFNL